MLHNSIYIGHFTFEVNSNLVFILKIRLAEQQSFKLFHFYLIPIYDNIFALRHILTFSQKHIERNDDSLTFTPIEDLSVCRRPSFMIIHVNMCGV